MTTKNADLYLNPQLLEIMRAGAKIVLPASNSLMAKLSYPRVLRLTQDMGIPPPVITAPSEGPWVSRALRASVDRLSADGFQTLEVDHGAALAEYVRARWARALEEYQNLSTLTLASPWPSWTRAGCSNEISFIPTLREIRKTYGTKPVIHASWGANVSPLPSVAISSGLIRWTPIQHHSIESLLAMGEGIISDTKPCHMCRLCPMQSASSIRSTASDLSARVVQALIDLEAETTFSFSDRHWLGELLASKLSAAQLDCHARTQSRAAMREAADLLVPTDRVGQAIAEATPTTLSEARAIATSRAMVSDALDIKIRCVTADEVREVLNRRYASAPPVKLALLPSSVQR